MIKFSNWNIEAIGQALGRQYDNLTRELRVEGIIPEGWTWDLLVQAGKNLDIIRLNQGENSLSVMLTSEMLALAGYYVLQLRATQGEKVRHTNVLRVYVPESLSGDGHWPEVPSEFTQLEQRVRELSEEAGAAAEQAENAAEGVANNAKAAQEAAGQAQTAQDAAQGSAKQAGAAAAASAELAKTAADSAAAATQAAQSASDAVSSAQTSAQTATAQAQAAADAAQQARQAQQAVETAAGNAAQSAQAAAEAQTQVAQVGAQVSADAEDARDAVTKSTAAAAQAGESARVAQEAAQQALGSVLPPATGLPDGYTLQTKDEQAVWGESSSPNSHRLLADFLIGSGGSASTLQDIGNIDDLSSFCLSIYSPDGESLAIDNILMHLKSSDGRNVRFGHMNAVTIDSGKRLCVKVNRFYETIFSISFVSNVPYMWQDKKLYAGVYDGTWVGFNALELSGGVLPEGTRIKMEGA